VLQVAREVGGLEDLELTRMFGIWSKL
jgi:hypothetical protein